MSSAPADAEARLQAASQTCGLRGVPLFSPTFLTYPIFSIWLFFPSARTWGSSLLCR